MPVRICEICQKEFGSGASYRTHKSTYHRPASQPEAVITETNLTNNPQTSQKESVTKALVPVEPKQEHEVSRGWSGGDDWGWLIAAGGAALAIIFMLFGGKRQ